MEGLEEYQDLGDDFWNYDHSSIYDNVYEGELDYDSDNYLEKNRNRKLKERSVDYINPFSLNEINSFREKLFNKFKSEDYKFYRPLHPTEGEFNFGKYKDEYVGEIFEKDIKYIEWLINETGCIFRLKGYYTFAINCGLKVPTLLINEMKMEYYEGTILNKRKIFDNNDIIEIKDEYYDLYL